MMHLRASGLLKSTVWEYGAGSDEELAFFRTRYGMRDGLCRARSRKSGLCSLYLFRGCIPGVCPTNGLQERRRYVCLHTYTRGSARARSALGVGLLCACAVKSSKGDSRDVINLIVGSGFYHVSV